MATPQKRFFWQFADNKFIYLTKIKKTLHRHFLSAVAVRVKLL
jgi:hypothetical protein